MVKVLGPMYSLMNFLIYTCDILASKITALFNVILMSGHFPKSWTEGVIIPIHKKGNKGAVDNYRRITLLSVFGKLFTRVLNNHLTFWAESYGILIEEQGGFREKRSTIDNIFVLHSLINLVTEKGGKVYTAFVDFRKAFDYVNRDCLWSKLITSGIRGNILNIIRSMYNEVKSKVKYMGNTSKTFECFLGVRQGESLSPFLFCMFVNDLKYCLESKGVEGVTVGDLKLCLILYADDSTLISANRECLQDSLDCLYNYCTKWGLFVNADKTKMVVFRKGGVLSHNDFWFYGDIKLEIVDVITHLGLNLSYTGKCSCTQRNIADRGLRVFYALKRSRIGEPQRSYIM